MNEKHPREIELTSLVDGGVEAGEHVDACRRCQSVVDEYRWLEREVTAALTGAANRVPVPRPRWHEIEARLHARGQRLRAVWRLSAVAGIILAVCLVIVVSSVLGTAATALASSPEMVCAPSPVAEAAVEKEIASTSVLTPRPLDEGTLGPAPVPHPSPSGPQIATRLP